MPLNILPARAQISHPCCAGADVSREEKRRARRNKEVKTTTYKHMPRVIGTLYLPTWADGRMWLLTVIG